MIGEEIDFSKIVGAPCMSDEDRLEHIRANVSATHRRVVIFDPVRCVLPFGEKPMVGKARGMEGTSMVWDIPRPHNRVAVLCCYGPSLADGLEEIAKHPNVVSVSGAHDFLLDHGIIPRWHVECDPRAHKGLMITPHYWPSYLMASCVHPDVIKKLFGYDVVLWHLDDDSLLVEPDALIIRGGGSVGLRAFPVLYALGFRKFIVHGLDMSFRGGSLRAGRHTGDVPTQIIEVECKGRVFSTSVSMLNYANAFRTQVEPHIGDGPAKIRVELRGDGLLQHWVGL